MQLAQMSPAAGAPIWIIAVAVVGLGLFIIAVTLVAVIARYYRTDRQLLHTERIRSLEAGIPYESTQSSQVRDKYLHNSFWIAFWLGFGVPSAAFSAAGSASQAIHNNLALGIGIWAGAAAASVAAVICATVLMIFGRMKANESAAERFGKVTKVA